MYNYYVFPANGSDGQRSLHSEQSVQFGQHARDPPPPADTIMTCISCDSHRNCRSTISDLCCRINFWRINNKIVQFMTWEHKPDHFRGHKGESTGAKKCYWTETDVVSAIRIVFAMNFWIFKSFYYKIFHF